MPNDRRKQRTLNIWVNHLNIMTAKQTLDTKLLVWNVQTANFRKLSSESEAQTIIALVEFRASWRTQSWWTTRGKLHTNINGDIAIWIPRKLARAVHLQVIFNVPWGLAVQAPDGGAWLIVHLDCAPPVRLKQLEEIRTLVADGRDWVLAGDWNFEPGGGSAAESAWWTGMEEGGFVDIWDGDGTWETHFRSQLQQVDKSARRLDWAIANRPGDRPESSVIPKVGLSDHAALLISGAIKEHPLAGEQGPAWATESTKRKCIDTRHLINICESGEEAGEMYRRILTAPAGKKAATGPVAFIDAVISALEAGAHPQAMQSALDEWTAGGEFAGTHACAQELAKVRRTLVAREAATSALNRPVLARRDCWRVGDACLKEGKTTINHIIDKEGTCIKNAAAMADTLVAELGPVFAPLVGTDSQEGVVDELVQKVVEKVGNTAGKWSDTPLTDDEIDTAIRKTAKHTRGRDGIEAAQLLEVLEASTDAAAGVRRLVRGVWEGDLDHPKIWDTVLSFIPKKRPWTTSNLRPIEVDSALAKVTSELLRNRLETVDIAGEWQFGFTRKKSASSAIALTNWAAEQRLTIVFIDFARAYTNVNTNKLFKLMEDLGTPKSLLEVASRLFRPRKMYLQLEGRLGKHPIAAQRGLRQGNSASPCLFNWLGRLIQEAIIKIAGGSIWGAPQFADDTAIILKKGATEEDMAAVQQAIGVIEAALDIPVNHDKTVLFSPSGLKGHPKWEVAQSFRYLGVNIPISVAGEELAERVATKLAMLEARLQRLRLLPSTAAAVWNTVGVASMVYVAPFATWTDTIVQRIEWTQRRWLGGCTSANNWYCGRALHLLSLPPEQGGLGAMAVRAIIVAAGATWARYVADPTQRPQQFREEGRAIVAALGRQIPAGSTRSPKTEYARALRDMLAKTTSHTDITTEEGWKSIHKLVVPHIWLFERDILWRLYYRIIPCDEFVCRHWEVVALTPCEWCGQPALRGPTHAMGCKQFWAATGLTPMVHPVPRGAAWHTQLVEWLKRASQIDISALVQLAWYFMRQRFRPPTQQSTAKRQARSPAAQTNRQQTRKRNRSPSPQARPDTSWITMTGPKGATAVIRKPEHWTGRKT